MAVKELTEGSKAKWDVFTSTLGKGEGDVAEALVGVVGDITDDAIGLLGNADDTPDADLRAALSRLGAIPSAVINKAIRGIRNAPAPIAGPATNGDASPREKSVLVSVGDDASILDLLRVGGVAKMTAEDLIAAIRGAFTRAIGVDQIIPTLLKRMKEHAESLDEPLGTTYYKLVKASKRRQYADVLAAFDGAVTSIPEDEKQRFLDKVDSLWPTLASFQSQLDAYRQLHKDESADIGNFVVAIQTGRAGIEYPDPSQIIAAARAVIDRFNRVFSGMGIPAARTIAKDIAEEAELLRNPELPGTVGAGSFEEMVKKIGLGVPSDARQTEINIATFVLNLLKLPDQPSNRQPEIIIELQKLGKPIVWPSGKQTASNGRSTPGRGTLRDGESTDRRY